MAELMLGFYSSVVLEAGHELGITPTNTGDEQLLKDGSL